VGGDPGRFGLSVGGFHEATLRRAARFPGNLLETSTHDTKRSADARARIGALASLPGEWAEVARACLAATEDLVAGGAPDGRERYALLQDLLAAWPIDAERLRGHVEKSLREAKVHTSWAEVDEDYEGRVQTYAAALLTHAPFLELFEPFVERVAEVAERHALGQVALKLTVPGLPDVYGGDELPFLALVDPDNRRPVDWGARRAALDALRAGEAPTAQTRKLFLIWRALELRARRPEVLADGAYVPLDAGEDVVAFVRGEPAEVLVVVPVREGGEGATLTLPEGRWRDVLTGEERDGGAAVVVAELVTAYGVGLFERA
jgi:(1->4)-alpha-D-glucan 1-alpha-D-glucosylmutase